MIPKIFIWSIEIKEFAINIVLSASHTFVLLLFWAETKWKINQKISERIEITSQWKSKAWFYSRENGICVTWNKI